MPVFLNGIAVQFFRGIGGETQYIYPFSQMNFFIGANNAGKSVVLDVIHRRLPSMSWFTIHNQNQARINVNALNQTDSDTAEDFRGQKSGPISVQVAVPFPELEIQTDHSRLELINQLKDNLGYNGFIWLGVKLAANTLEWHNERELKSQSWFDYKEWFDLWQAVTGNESTRTPGGLNVTWPPEVIKIITGEKTPELRASMLVPAKRQIGPKDEAFDDLTGKGLVDHLTELQNPDHTERERKKTFDKINDFVRVVTGKPDARLEIPSSRQHILVHIDNKILPLSSLGTGIHEIILIAAFCTIHQNVIMCLEEPEIHLHPILQRQLIRYLQENTENQYFIATHSAAFIDMPGSSVFHVTNDGDQTRVHPVIIKEDKRELCRDLGYRPSDIVQSNAVVWVEGPSDRIYLEHWISAVAPDLIEGTHYTILFYGGALVSHLSVDDEATTNFIHLRDLNGNMAIVLDSDRASPRGKLKPAVARIRDEMERGSGIVWITKGREIENYVQPDMLHRALKEMHPKIYGRPLYTGPYDNSFHFVKSSCSGKGDPYTGADKVGVAKLVCQHEPDFTVLDLEVRVSEIVEMIRKANKPN
ncbi:MAG: AAA family ATPase [Pseudomonadota bacterium]